MSVFANDNILMSQGGRARGNRGRRGSIDRGAWVKWGSSAGMGLHMAKPLSTKYKYNTGATIAVARLGENTF